MSPWVQVLASFRRGSRLLRRRTAQLLPLLALALAGCGRTQPESSAERQVQAELSSEIIYFRDPDCPDCHEVERSLLPAILDQEALAPVSVHSIDVTTPAGARALLRMEQTVGLECRVLAPVLVVRGRPLCGIESIREAAARNVSGRPPVDPGPLSSASEGG